MLLLKKNFISQFYHYLHLYLLNLRFLRILSKNLKEKKCNFFAMLFVVKFLMFLKNNFLKLK